MANLTEKHEISQESYDERVRLFFSDEMPEPYVVEAVALRQALQNATDPNAAVIITGDGANHKDNSDLKYTVSPQAEATAGGGLRIAYSVSLFRELFETLTFGTVAFSKASGSAGAADIIFQLRDTSTIVYCGDVSHQWP